MKIVFSSNARLSSPKAVDHLRSLIAQHPRLKVVSVGGAANPWSTDFADAYVDTRPVQSQCTLIGDIHGPGLWRKIKSEGFNFCICSLTLEFRGINADYPGESVLALARLYRDAGEWGLDNFARVRAGVDHEIDPESA
jgi:hypothetical protein